MANKLVLIGPDTFWYYRVSGLISRTRLIPIRGTVASHGPPDVFAELFDCV